MDTFLPGLLQLLQLLDQSLNTPSIVTRRFKVKKLQREREEIQEKSTEYQRNSKKILAKELKLLKELHFGSHRTSLHCQGVFGPEAAAKLA